MTLWVVILYFTLYQFFASLHVHSLKITDLRVPSKAYHDALLDCRYDLEGAALYDVKWYKDNEQFFRCIPGQSHEYPQDGVKIYYDRYPSTGSCSFRLIALNAKSEGEYKCEVSTEGPVFTTAVESARLRVVPVPYLVPYRPDDGDSRVITRYSPTTHLEESNTTWNAYSSRGTTASICRCLTCEGLSAMIFWRVYHSVL